jgi:hypothetical protein
MISDCYTISKAFLKEFITHPIISGIEFKIKCTKHNGEEIRNEMYHNLYSIG